MNIKDQKLFYTFQTSLNEYNNHVTNIVALKNQILLNKENLPEKEYDLMLELVYNIYEIDKDTWDSVRKQGIEHIVKTQGLAESDATLAII